MQLKASPVGEVVEGRRPKTGGVKISREVYLCHPSVSYADSSPTGEPRGKVAFIDSLGYPLGELSLEATEG